MRLIVCIGVLLTAGYASLAAAAGANDPTGQWLVEDGSAIVQIAPCGPALCGTVIWSQKPSDARGQKLCNLAILGEAVSAGPAKWDKGWVYSPKANGRYPVELKLTGDGTLHLHVSAGLFGRDQVWTRPTQPVTQCVP
jgi:uncharacterized protein (DUF2147 family)